ncbi:hypothetical protein CYMTET_12680, partial [Cymbomonas tetramitiformis]
MHLAINAVNLSNKLEDAEQRLLDRVVELKNAKSELEEVIFSRFEGLSKRRDGPVLALKRAAERIARLEHSVVVTKEKVKETRRRSATLEGNGQELSDLARLKTEFGKCFFLNIERKLERAATLQCKFQELERQNAERAKLMDKLKSTIDGLKNDLATSKSDCARLQLIAHKTQASALHEVAPALAPWPQVAPVLAPWQQVVLTLAPGPQVAPALAPWPQVALTLAPWPQVKEVHAQKLGMDVRISTLSNEIKKIQEERDEVIEDLIVAQDECLKSAANIVHHGRTPEDSDDEGDHQVHQVTLQPTLQKRAGKGNAVMFTPELLTEYHRRIVDEFELSGPRISEMFHRVLGLFTGVSLVEVQDMAPLPSKTSYYQHVRMMGHVKRLEMSQDRDDALPFFATEADEGSKGRSKLMIAFALFKKKNDDAGKRLLAGATRISNITAEVSLRGILKGFCNINWSTLYLLWITGDSCSSMKAMVPLVADEKCLEFAEALARDDMAYPDFLPIDVTVFFLVHVDRPRQLIPLHGAHYIDDANHMPKNGEAAMFKELGSGVNLASGKLVLGFLKGELFRWSRLHKASHEFRDLVRYLEPSIQKLYKTIPAEINHRLTIATRLAELYNDFRVPLMSVCEKFNYAYGGDKWRGDRQATLDHMREVYASLSDVRVQAWSLLLRRLHDFSVEVYTITQYNNGINVAILRAQSEDILENLEGRVDIFRG